jgi:hypothetical protein
MKNIVAIALLFLTTRLYAGDVASAAGSTNENPYQVIAERNAFALKPPPPPPVEVDDPPAPPAVDIKLSGVCSLFTTSRALFVVLESGRTAPSYLSLGEGERAGELEVVEINIEASQVRVRHRRELLLLSFESHGLKTVPLPAAAVTVPPPLPPAPGANPAGTPPAAGRP